MVRTPFWLRIFFHLRQNQKQKTKKKTIIIIIVLSFKCSMLKLKLLMPVSTSLKGWMIPVWSPQPVGWNCSCRGPLVYSLAFFLPWIKLSFATRKRETVRAWKGSIAHHSARNLLRTDPFHLLFWHKWCLDSWQVLPSS